MDKVSKEEFYKFYTKEIFPYIMPYEKKRAAYDKTATPLKKFVLTLFAIFLTAFLIMFFKGFLSMFEITTTQHAQTAAPFLSLMSTFIFAPIMILGAIATMAIYALKTNGSHKNIKKELKHGLITKIFNYCHAEYSSTTAKEITLLELQKAGLPITSKIDDDTITGTYKGVNFIINETLAGVHLKKEGSALLRLLILKLEMNKNFSSQTVVMPKYIKYDKKESEEVILEDANFMKLNAVYSTDQVEARYLLTTAFIERLKSLGITFVEKCLDNQMLPIQYKYLLQENPTCLAAFDRKYVYIIANTTVDNFDLPLDKSLYNFDAYYNIYTQFFELLSTIDCLKLNEKTGI